MPIRPAPNPQTISNLISTQNALLETLISFLTVCTHQVLFLRKVYPPGSFIAARKYNYSVRQNRHPVVCDWINDALKAVRDQLEKNVVKTVSICVISEDEDTGDSEVRERWTFDLRSLPVVQKKEREIQFAVEDDRQPKVEDEVAGEQFAADMANENEHDVELTKKLNLANLEAEFRAALVKLNSAAARLKPLSIKEGQSLTFTMTIEVKEDADRPVGRRHRLEREWIAAEHEAFDDESQASVSADDSTTVPGSRKCDGRTVPIRRVQAGELRLELFVEESRVDSHNKA